VTVNDVLAMIGRVFGCRPVITSTRRRRATCGIPAPTRRARADLGFGPAVGLEQGLAAEFQWLSKNLLSKHL